VTSRRKAENASASSAPRRRIFIDWATWFIGHNVRAKDALK
jgi:hypothetical protein